MSRVRRGVDGLHLVNVTPQVRPPASASRDDPRVHLEMYARPRSSDVSGPPRGRRREPSARPTIRRPPMSASWCHRPGHDGPTARRRPAHDPHPHPQHEHRSTGVPRPRASRPGPSTPPRSTARARPRSARSTASTVDFATGRFTAIMGPSGSGKSTLMHALAGLDTLTDGSVWIGDTELGSLNDKKLTQLRRDRIGFIFQSFNLIPTLTAAENITLPMKLAGRKPDRGVVRHRRRHRRSRRPARRTARRSSPVVSSSASPWPVRSRAGRRSSSPTSPPATSTPARAPRSSRSCVRPCASSARRS